MSPISSKSPALPSCRLSTAAKRAPYTDQQKTNVRSIFVDIRSPTNLSCTQTVASADADISLVRGNLEKSSGGRGRFVCSRGMISGQQVATRYDGLVVFNETQPLTTAKDLTLPIYEIGHALTIGHPGNVDINPANAPPPPYLLAAEDSYKFTVMSYNILPEYSARPDTYMLYDVAALQYRFGANMATRSGDTS